MKKEGLLSIEEIRKKLKLLRNDSCFQKLLTENFNSSTAERHIKSLERQGFWDEQAIYKNMKEGLLLSPLLRLLRGSSPLLKDVMLLIVLVLQAKKGAQLEEEDAKKEAKLLLSLIGNPDQFPSLPKEVPSINLFKKVELLVSSGRKGFSLEAFAVKRDLEQFTQRIIESLFGFEEAKGGVWVTIVDSLSFIATCRAVLQGRKEITVEDIQVAYTDFLRLLAQPYS